MFPFLSTQRKPGWLSVLVQNERLTLVHVRRRAGARPEVHALDSFALEGGTAAALQRLKSARGLRAYACTTLMGEGEYGLVQLDAPPVAREERREALRWALRDSVPFPVESACLDVLDLPAEAAPGRAAGVLVAAAGEQAVRQRAAPFEAAGVSLTAIDIPELAQRNVAALLEDENRGLVFLRLDEQGMMLTLTFGGELVAVRRGEMTTRQLADGDADQAARVRERLVLELQRSLDNFDRQYSQVPVSRVVLASDPPVEGLAAELAANVYVPVLEMDLSGVLGFAAVPELKDVRVQTRHLLAIGAALRSGEAA